MWVREMVELEWGKMEESSEKKKDKPLQVHQARESDIFQDAIRIHKNEIIKRNLQRYKHNVLILVLNNKRKSVWLRTLEPKDLERFRESQQKKISPRDKARFKDYYKGGAIRNPDCWILMDESLRDFFGIELYNMCDFKFINAGLLDRISFYAKHSDPLVRYSFWLAFLSVVISIIALMLGLF